MSVMSHKNRLTVNCFDLMYIAIFLFFVVSCLPIVLVLPGAIRNGMQIVATAMFSLGIILYNDKKKWLQFFAIVLFSTVFVYGVWHEKKTLSSCAINVITGWAFCFFGLILWERGDLRRNRRLLIIILVIIAITAITTIIGIQRYPLVVRELGRGGSSYSGVTGNEFTALKMMYRRNNIAGWNQLFGIAFLVGPITYLYYKTKRKIILVLIALCEICVVMSQLTYALFLSVFNIVMTIFMIKNRKRSKSSIIVALVVFITALIVLIEIDSIVLFLSNSASKYGYKMLAIKLNDLYMFTQGIHQGDVTARFNLYSIGIREFFQHPLGLFLYNGLKCPDLSQHSDFFDMIGFYGIFGIVAVIGCVLYYFRWIGRQLEEYRSMLTIQLVTFLTMFAINPVWYSPQVFLSAFLLPSLIAGTSNEFTKDDVY